MNKLNLKIKKLTSWLLISLLTMGCSPVTKPVQAVIATYTPVITLATPMTELSPTPKITSNWKIEKVVEGLEVPWSIVFSSTERMLVAERPGRVREVVDGQLNPEPLYTFVDVINREETGLMGLALDPDYAQNQFIYACYTSQNEDGLINRVVRMTDASDRLELDEVLLDDIPSAQYHAGCRLAFGPDGKLYVTTGDAQQPALAQKLDSLAGKILRVNRDGSIPADNPFAGSPVYSLGHRNPQGIAWQPGSGLMYATEHGPSGFDGPEGGDEINLIQSGSNYGWPLVSHAEILSGTESPLIQFTPAVAPAAAMFYDSDLLPIFNGKLFFGALRGEGLAMVSLSSQDPEKILQVEWLVTDVGRVREVTENPDGLIYFSTSNRDGRGTARTGDDKIYRIVPIYE